MSEDAHESNKAETETPDHIGAITDQMGYMAFLLTDARKMVKVGNLLQSLALISKLNETMKDLVFNIAVEIGRRAKP